MFHQIALVLRPSSSCTSTCSTLSQPRPPSSTGMVARVEPALAGLVADVAAVGLRQPPAGQLRRQLQRDQHLVHEGGGAGSQLTLPGGQCEVHSKLLQSSPLGRVVRLVVAQRRRQQVLLAQHRRQPLRRRRLLAGDLGRLQPRPAVAQVVEPVLHAAVVDQPLDPARLHVGVARPEGGQQRRHLALDLGRQEQPAVIATDDPHGSSMPGTACRSRSWNASTPFSLRFSTPRS